MTGFEPTTFCMANASDQFAPVRTGVGLGELFCARGPRGGGWRANHRMSGATARAAALLDPAWNRSHFTAPPSAAREVGLRRDGRVVVVVLGDEPA
jgi:hypothetical protein